MTTTEPTHEAVEELARIMAVAFRNTTSIQRQQAGTWALVASAVLAAGYVRPEDFEPDPGNRQHPAVLRLRAVRAENERLRAKLAGVDS